MRFCKVEDTFGASLGVVVDSLRSDPGSVTSAPRTLVMSLRRISIGAIYAVLLRADQAST